MIFESQSVNAFVVLEKIRSLLNLTVDEFCFQMNWPNHRYYDYMKSGRKNHKTQVKVVTSPTINKIFDGINYALDNYQNWKMYRDQITSIVVMELIKK